MLLVLGRQQVTASNTQSLIVMHMKFLWRLSGMRQTPKTRYRLGWKRVMVSCQATNSIGQKVQSCSIIRWFKRRTEHYNSVFLVIAGLYAVMITFNVTKAKHIHTDRAWNAWARSFSYTIICTPTDRRRFILQRTANSWAKCSNLTTQQTAALLNISSLVGLCECCAHSKSDIELEKNSNYSYCVLCLWMWMCVFVRVCVCVCFYSYEPA